MDSAKQHWKILQGLGTDLANRVSEFMVIGWNGEGVIVATEDGLGFWLGQMKFGWGKSKTATKPTLLEVTDLVQMAQNHQHILLLNKRGEIYSMGQNNWGQLGLGTEVEEIHFTPQLIPSPHKFISFRCGIGYSVALTEDGKVWAWGDNRYSQVGVPSSTHYYLPSPRQIPELNPHRVVAVECGSAHSLALTDQGEVYTWGLSRYRELGRVCPYSVRNGNLSVIFQYNQFAPTRIPTPSPVRSMAAGDSHTLLLTKTGEVWACGDNEKGQLGIPTATQCSASLVKVAGLPPISQIATHYNTNLSIAISSDKRCFVWGELRDEKSEEMEISISTPLKLPPFYSTVDSLLSFFSLYPNTPHSIQIPETPPSPLSARMSRMFDNPETSPDVQFVVEQRTIHAHRIILNNSSDYFARMFSEKWLAPVDPEDPIVKVTISDHSYQVFYTLLRFLYTDYLKVHSDLLPEMFELANLYLVPELQQLFLSRMRATVTTATCCLYYPLTHRHSLPELKDFQEDLVQFASTRMSKITPTATYKSMEPDLRSNFTNAVQNIQATTSNSTSKELNQRSKRSRKK